MRKSSRPYWHPSYGLYLLFRLFTWIHSPSWMTLMARKLKLSGSWRNLDSVSKSKPSSMHLYWVFIDLCYFFLLLLLILAFVLQERDHEFSPTSTFFCRPIFFPSPPKPFELPTYAEEIAICFARNGIRNPTSHSRSRSRSRRSLSFLDLEVVQCDEQEWTHSTTHDNGSHDISALSNKTYNIVVSFFIPLNSIHYSFLVICIHLRS